MTWRWAKRRHPKKSLKWIKSEYFQEEGSRKWVFWEKKGKDRLMKMSDIPVRRHVKIKADANPYDPDWCDYFTERENKKHKRNVRSERSRMWIKQHGICPICQLPPDSDEEEWDYIT